MNKSDALKRLDAIETEAKELRKIIDGKIEYKEDKLYVGVMSGQYLGNGGYILVGTKGSFAFYCFRESPTQQHWSSGHTSGQSCIDNFVANGGTVHEFDDVREGFKFFLENYKG